MALREIDDQFVGVVDSRKTGPLARIHEGSLGAILASLMLRLMKGAKDAEPRPARSCLGRGVTSPARAGSASRPTGRSITTSLAPTGVGSRDAPIFSPRGYLRSKRLRGSCRMKIKEIKVLTRPQRSTSSSSRAARLAGAVFEPTPPPGHT